MQIRWFKAVALVAAAGVFGAGCIIDVGPSRAVYETCTNSASCAGLSVCRTSDIVLPGQVAGQFCTLTCSNSANCPIGATGQGICLSTGGSGRCYAPCGAGAACPLGSSCGQVMSGGVPIQVCVPGVGGGPGPGPACGAIGQPCCAGNACSDASGACASDGICKPAAYLGCTAASVEARAQCTDALTNGANRVQTTCQRPPFINAGPDGFCTAVCDGTNESCPRFPGSTSGCYRFEGMTVPMCFVDCATNPNVCPTGTACVELTGNTGARVRVCAPPVR
jgi:hypothetical protein